MPYAQTSTSLGALSSVASGSWVAIPKGSGQQDTGGGAGPVVAIVATSVTTGLVVAIEGRRRTSIANDSGLTPTKELHRATVAANGNVIVPLKDLVENGTMPDEIRITVVSRTDGTVTSTVLTAA